MELPSWSTAEPDEIGPLDAASMRLRRARLEVSLTIALGFVVVTLCGVGILWAIGYFLPNDTNRVPRISIGAYGCAMEDYNQSKSSVGYKSELVFFPEDFGLSSDSNSERLAFFELDELYMRSDHPSSGISIAPAEGVCEELRLWLDRDLELSHTLVKLEPRGSMRRSELHRVVYDSLDSMKASEYSYGYEAESTKRTLEYRYGEIAEPAINDEWTEVHANWQEPTNVWTWTGISRMRFAIRIADPTDFYITVPERVDYRATAAESRKVVVLVPAPFRIVPDSIVPSDFRIKSTVVSLFAPGMTQITTNVLVWDASRRGDTAYTVSVVDPRWEQRGQAFLVILSTVLGAGVAAILEGFLTWVVLRAQPGEQVI